MPEDPFKEGLNKAVKNLESDPSRSWRARINRPTNKEELGEWIEEYLNIRIPPNACCEEHTAPLDAISEAYFAEYPRTVWYASRLVGKTVLLATLSLTEAITLGASVTLLGGSGEQSQRVHAYLEGEDTNLPTSFWAAPDAPRWIWRQKTSTKRRTKLKNGGNVTALMASPTSIRGPHPQRLRGDEIDEMDKDLWDASQGQAVPARGILEQTVGSSTWHNPKGTMTREIQEARANGWPVRTWCLPPKGKVLSDEGIPVSIDDINVGDYVLSGEGESRHVSKLWEREYSGDLIEFEVKGLPEPIRLTADHELPTENKGWIPAGDLEKDDIVLQPTIPLEPGGNFDLGWIVGLYLAEGHHTNINTISFSVNDSEVDNVINQIEKIWDCGPTIDPDNGKFGSDDIHVYSLPQKATTIQISHIGIADLLKEWVNIGERDNGPYQGNQARVKKLNKFPTEKEFARGVFLGWLFGDGYKIKSGHREGNTASENLAWQMFQISQALGYSTSLAKYENRPGPTRREEALDLTIWRVISNNFYPPVRRENQVTFYAARQKYEKDVNKSYRSLGREFGTKHTTIKEWLEWDGQPNWAQPRIIGNKFGRRVTNVKRIPYEGPVYDITVDVDHTFLAGGVTVSNCWRCVLEENEGWLSRDFIERKRNSVTKRTWEVEFDLSRPSPEGRFIVEEAIDFTFDEELGNIPGNINQDIIFEEPVEGGEYATGADWAKSRDRSIIVTLRTDVDPMRVVQFAHMGHIPFNLMVDKFNETVEKYDSHACHDATGLGAVIHDYIDVVSEGVVLKGKRRSHIFSEYVKGMERAEIKSPYIEYMREEHLYAITQDFYGTGHPPDTIVAMALAYRAAETLEIIY